MTDSKPEDGYTHFGYQRVEVEEKVAKVTQVFDSVAQRYDLMNDLMSFGIHRWWKHFSLGQAGVRPGDYVLDLASGTGDLALKLCKQVGEDGHVVASDINQSMLSVAKQRLIDAGVVSNVSYVLANAEDLPFPDNHFDCITIAFGLRNVTHKENALAEMYRVLKPGGKTLILEFSKPTLPGLQTLYDTYSFKILPWLGKLVVDDAKSYQYLVESIRQHPDQETLCQMMRDAGLSDCYYHNLTGGIVALHRGYKY